MPTDDLHEKFIRDMLATRKEEALEWLRASSELSFRNIGEMPTSEQSIAFVQRLYELGAHKVLAVRIDEYPEGQNTGHLLAQLPRDRFARGNLFAFEREHAESLGFDGAVDVGQDYLYFKLD